MKLNRLGDFIEQTLETNSSLIYTTNDVMGMTITKQIIPTKANVMNTDLRNFLVINPGEFVYNPRTHGKKIGLGFNNTKKPFIISWNNIGFRIKKSMQDHLIPEYLYMNFIRSEWDRLATFNSWGSSTEVLNWDTLCDIEIVIPTKDEQKKAVDVYLAMLANQLSYERALDDLKLTCDAYIENLRRNSPKRCIKQYITESFERNANSSIPSLGVSRDKKFIQSKRESESYENYKVVKYLEFAFRPVLDDMDSPFTVALNQSTECAVSPAYIVFGTNNNVLLPQYLMLWLSRTETERWLAYNAWGSARNTIELDDLGNLEIPIPDLSVQKSIVEVFEVYEKRKMINEKLKNAINELCPILIKGGIEKQTYKEDKHVQPH